MKPGRNIDVGRAPPHSLHELVARLGLGEVFVHGDGYDDDDHCSPRAPSGYKVDPHFRDVAAICRRDALLNQGSRGGPPAGVPKTPVKDTPKTAPPTSIGVSGFRRPETTCLRDAPVTDADLYATPVDQLGLTAAFVAALRVLDIQTLGDLVVRLPVLWMYRGMGDTRIRIADQAVKRAARAHALRRAEQAGNVSTRKESS